jgi:hypothetical protein
MAEKTEVPGIYKVREGILINKDNDSLKSYKKRKHREMRFNEMDKELTEMKADIAEIKIILQQLVK